MDNDLTLRVNGQLVRRPVPSERSLLQLLRDDLRLTGTHQGCDTAQCGACTVLLDGAAVKSCNLLALQAEGCAVRTIEDLAAPGAPLHPMQQAFGEHHGLQCGFCTPGMVMRAVGMADEPVPAEPDAVRRALSGNLCRCTGYQGIVDAVCQGLRCMREAHR
jgi:carbon-monoxide dehydrogenase small subunit